MSISNSVPKEVIRDTGECPGIYSFVKGKVHVPNSIQARSYGTLPLYKGVQFNTIEDALFICRQYFLDINVAPDANLKEYKQQIGIGLNNPFTDVYWTAFTEDYTLGNGSDEIDVILCAPKCSAMLNTNEDDANEFFWTDLNGDSNSTPHHETQYDRAHSRGIYSGLSRLADPLENAICFIPRTAWECIPGPVEGDITSLCTAIPSKNPLGDTCNAVFQNLSTGAQDSAMQGVCTSYPDLAECDCVKRTTRDAYTVARQDPITHTIPDGCWWIPCKVDDRSTWVTSQDLAGDGQCPTNLCLNIVDFDELDSSQVTELNQYVTCAQKSDGGPSAGGGDGTGVNIGLIVGIGVGVLALMFIAGAIVAAVKKSKENASGAQPTNTDQSEAAKQQAAQKQQMEQQKVAKRQQVAAQTAPGKST